MPSVLSRAWGLRMLAVRCVALAALQPHSGTGRGVVVLQACLALLCVLAPGWPGWGQLLPWAHACLALAALPPGAGAPTTSSSSSSPLLSFLFWALTCALQQDGVPLLVSLVALGAVHQLAVQAPAALLLRPSQQLRPQPQQPPGAGATGAPEVDLATLLLFYTAAACGAVALQCVVGRQLGPRWRVRKQQVHITGKGLHGASSSTPRTPGKLHRGSQPSTQQTQPGSPMKQQGMDQGAQKQATTQFWASGSCMDTTEVLKGAASQLQRPRGMKLHTALAAHLRNPTAAYYAGVHSLGALFVLSYIADSHQLRARGLISWDTFWPSLVMPSINAACCVSRVAAVLMDHWSWRSTWVNELAWYTLLACRLVVTLLQPFEPRPNGVWRCYTLFLLVGTASTTSMAFFSMRAIIGCASYSMLQAWVLGLPHPPVPGLPAPVTLPGALSTFTSRALLGVPEYPAIALLVVLLFAALQLLGRAANKPYTSRAAAQKRSEDAGDALASAVLGLGLLGCAFAWAAWSHMDVGQRGVVAAVVRGSRQRVSLGWGGWELEQAGSSHMGVLPGRLQALMAGVLLLLAAWQWGSGIFSVCRALLAVLARRCKAGLRHVHRMLSTAAHRVALAWPTKVPRSQPVHMQELITAAVAAPPTPDLDMGAMASAMQQEAGAGKDSFLWASPGAPSSISLWTLQSSNRLSAPEAPTISFSQDLTSVSQYLHTGQYPGPSISAAEFSLPASALQSRDCIVAARPVTLSTDHMHPQPAFSPSQLFSPATAAAVDRLPGTISSSSPRPTSGNNQGQLSVLPQGASPPQASYLQVGKGSETRREEDNPISSRVHAVVMGEPHVQSPTPMPRDGCQAWQGTAWQGGDAARRVVLRHSASTSALDAWLGQRPACGHAMAVAQPGGVYRAAFAGPDFTGGSRMGCAAVRGTSSNGQQQAWRVAGGSNSAAEGIGMMRSATLNNGGNRAAGVRRSLHHVLSAASHVGRYCEEHAVVRVSLFVALAAVVVAVSMQHLWGCELRCQP